jgi:hypothetical protein
MVATDLLWLCVAAYVVAQVVVLVRPSGPSRVVAAVPMVVMVPIFLLTIVAYTQGSNLWPLWLLLASPVALLYVVVVSFFGQSTAKPS